MLEMIVKLLKICFLVTAAAVIIAAATFIRPYWWGRALIGLVIGTAALLIWLVFIPWVEEENERRRQEAEWRRQDEKREEWRRMGITFDKDKTDKR